MNKAFISSDTLEVDFSRTLEMQEKILFGGEKTESCCLEKSVCHFFHRWLADRVKSIEDLDLQGQGYKVPEVYWEKSVNIDVVEENVWNLKPEDLFGLSETREIAEVPENDGK
ncbi:hypothetical protein [Kosmotoga olearia]|uniref:Uncharacterized protein n=1 Tax=Kosmotoga olearia (strain ATCC BAA-1733 / DSM 21960 / TBF 19.5.1) TaxID=521045 RepID=C5CHK3_KOSOT|nr:hypothetical protein [Kosmotoga olearia]ACR79758.1 hypothetical protein Kole_1054 [Kosmotoga olearia TBF 19.5.1]